MEELVGLNVGATFDLAFFELIDGVEDLFQGGGVLRHVELAAPDAGDFDEGILVELLPARGDDAAIGQGDHVNAGGADGDGVNFDAEGGGEAGGVLGAELAGVVSTVGEQDDDFAGDGLLVEPTGGGGDAGADGGAVFHDAGLHAVDVGLQPLVIEGEGAGGVGGSGEGDDADAVVSAAFDEVPHHPFGGGEAIDGNAADAEVLNEHGEGDIDSEGDGDAFGLGLVCGGDFLGSGEADDGGGE